MPTVEGAPEVGPYEYDLITREELAEWFNVKPRTIEQWRYGRQGTMPVMPYLRIGLTTYYSKRQITWWLNELQKRPDPYFVDRMNRLKEGIKVAKRKR